jgi:rare lipoprotein A
VAIQAGAFASKDRADAAAAKIGGQVSRAGSVWRVRKGPFATRAEAEAALAQVRAAGYSDARIQRAD